MGVGWGVGCGEGGGGVRGVGVGGVGVGGWGVVGVGGALTWGTEHTGRLVAVVVPGPVKLGNGPQQRPSLPRVFPESQPQAWSWGGGITLRVPPPPAPRQALRGFQATPMLTPNLTHTWTPPSPADTLGHTHTGVRLLPLHICAPRSAPGPHGHTHPHHDPRLAVTVTGASCPPLWGLPGNDSACRVSGCGGRGTWRGCGGRSCCPVSGRHPRPLPARLAGPSPWCAEAGGAVDSGYSALVWWLLNYWLI